MSSNNGYWLFVHVFTKHVLKSTIFQTMACQTAPYVWLASLDDDERMEFLIFPSTLLVEPESISTV